MTSPLTGTSADADPLAITEDFLPVPERAVDVDLTGAFTKLLFRSSVTRRRREEDARAAASTQRDLLRGLLEVDDALGAIQGRQAVPGYGLLPREHLDVMAAAIQTVLRRKLAGAGVTPMRLDGYLAQPAVSDIVERRPQAGIPAETVMETLITGFYWNDEVLRRGQVLVSSEAPAEFEPTPPSTEAAAPDGAPGAEPAQGAGATSADSSKPRRKPFPKKPRRGRSNRSRHGK
ncbi:hypothetical protein [Streptacidiphilus sp. EB129]|uniref:nucleotide exchange factor GrpE n=1 Tax=Streptacidiphilus sp. EB129 TaxID=3156262 RepID=UPI0035142C78